MKIYLFGLLLFLFSCTSHENAETLNSIKIREVPKDIKLPRNLFKELEKELSDELKITGPVFIFMPLRVQFKNKKDQNTLSDNLIQYDFEKGGGQINLSEIIKNTGSFYMSFPSEQFASTHELMHLYYISQAPVKKIEEESFGLGCGKWVDLKNKFKNLQDPEFLKLNTTKLRHLFVLAGHYVFVFKQSNQIYLTQLTITDSKNSKELCTSLGEVQ